MIQGQGQAQSQSRSSNQLLVQQASQALQQLKYEVAQELGIQIPQDGYYGYMATRDTGAIGGNMVRRLVQIAEQQLSGSMNMNNRY
ncbi:alpha/beta-type small acid-soluble spore protein [Paenibacillus cremeus]|uniref:Alpha/beta-type small acid-soluble spore protein n=1 Tax=Paenibacillus cremeus TaxID=2163881 RepID=A0A559K7L2_9BACL|nr:alpha/beta-type small acid-soluble spore protein [Paenibacillus cremeus]TVY08121.1 alpha/beta-type small acid-soluble spore protein [Paenibacillus cremeus]